MKITEKDLMEFSPSRHNHDVGMIMSSALIDGLTGAITEIDYAKLYAGSEEQFVKNSYMGMLAYLSVIEQTVGRTCEDGEEK